MTSFGEFLEDKEAAEFHLLIVTAAFGRSDYLQQMKFGGLFVLEKFTSVGHPNSSSVKNCHLMVIELKHPIFGFEQSNIEL